MQVKTNVDCDAVCGIMAMQVEAFIAYFSLLEQSYNPTVIITAAQLEGVLDIRWGLLGLWSQVAAPLQVGNYKVKLFQRLIAGLTQLHFDTYSVYYQKND